MDLRELADPIREARWMREKAIPLALPPGLHGLDLKLNDCMGIPFIPLNEDAFQLLQNADLIGKEFAQRKVGGPPSFAEMQRSFVSDVVEKSGRAPQPFHRESEKEALDAFRRWAVPELPGVRQFLAGMTTKRPLLPSDADTGMARLLVANQQVRNLVSGNTREEIWTGEKLDAQKGLLGASRYHLNYQTVENMDPYTRIQFYLQGKVENKDAERVLLNRLQEIRMETARDGSYDLTPDEEKLLDEKRSQQTAEFMLQQKRMEQAKRMQGIFLEWWGKRQEQLWSVKDPVVTEGPEAFLKSVLFPFLWEEDQRIPGGDALTNLCFLLSKNPMLVMKMISDRAPAPQGQDLQDMRDAVDPVMKSIRETLEDDVMLEDQVGEWMMLLYRIVVAFSPDPDAFFHQITGFLQVNPEDPLEELIFDPQLWTFSSLFFPSSSPENPLLPAFQAMGV